MRPGMSRTEYGLAVRDTATTLAAGTGRRPGAAASPGRLLVPRTARLDLGWMLVVSAAVTLALYASTASLPFFSESFSHQGRVAAYASWWQVLDPEQVPFRPLQHLYFCVLGALGSPEPWLARVPGFALYLMTALLVADLARQLGCSRAGTWLALLAYLCFPSVKALVWVAAISNPGRVACVLAGLCLFVRHLERPRAATGIGVLVAQVLALGFHQSGIVLAAACALLAWASAGSPLVRGWAPAVRRLREPWLVALLALVVAYSLAMGVMWSQRYPHSSPAAIVANLARASLALAPESLRHPAIEGLRRNWGVAGFAFGATAVTGMLLAYAAALRVARPRGRALLLVIGLDLLLPALSVGFVVRYAQLAAALGACVLGLGHDALAERPRARRVLYTALVLLLAGWVSRAVVADASALRARVGPQTMVTIVDLPETWGRERDIPLFNWGTRRALALAGAPGHWKLVRTTRGIGSYEAEWITPQELAEQPRPMLVFDAATARLVELDEASR
jgi:hypothetical protein